MNRWINFISNRSPLDTIHDPRILWVADEGLPERITKCAVPFIMMNRVAGTVGSIVLDGTKSMQLFCSSVDAFQDGDLKSGVFRAVQASGVIGLGALSYFRPRTGVLLSVAHQIATRLYVLGKHGYNGQKKAVAKDVVDLARDMAFLASIFCPRSDVVLLSLAFQTAMEVGEAGQEFYDGRYLEGCTHLALGFIRARAAVPHLEPTRREWFGRDLTQAEFSQILSELNSRDIVDESMERIDLNQILKERNIRAQLDGLVVDKCCNLSKVAFANLTIKDCQFRKVDMHNSLFVNASISRSDFTGANLSDSIFQNAHIDNSCFARTFFFGVQFENVHFGDCYFGQAQFINARIEKTTFECCRLPEANFFRARAHASAFFNSDLTDTYLFGAKPGFIIIGGKPRRITRPVVGFLSNESGMSFFNELEAAGLRGEGAAVVQIPYNPGDINPALLDQEVQQGLTKLGGNAGSYSSLPQALVGEAVRDSQIGRIRDMALEASLECNGFFLPGGADIEPELYGQSRNEQTSTAGDFKRSIMEAAVYAVARDCQIPIWGICRGSQALAINAGAQLNQHVDGHGRIWHDLRPGLDASPEVLEKLDKILGGRELLSPSFHHQAVTEAPEGFTALLEHRGVIKLMVSDDGLVLSTQVHPEVFVTWGDLSDWEMEVALDPKKLSPDEVRRDWKLLIASLLDQEARKPYDPNEYSGHSTRNQRLFTHFVGLAQEYLHGKAEFTVEVA